MFRLFGGKHPEFTIEIDRADAVYYPGDTVRAKVTLASEREAKFDEISVGLLCEERLRRRDGGGEVADDAEDLWHTDARWAGREIIAREGTLPAKYRQIYELAWQIPAQVTASYNGELAQVRWMVRASVDRQGARVTTRDVPLGVVVAPPNHFVSPGEFVEDNPASRTLDVKFALPKLEYVQNEEVTGRLLLVARERFTADDLQIELVRTEHVSAATAAAGAITRRVVEAAQALAQNVALGAGDPLGFDFRLQVPPKWCPSYRTPHGYAIWQLQVTIPHPTNGESRAIQSLLVFNGYANTDAAEAGASANQNFAQDFPAEQPATRTNASGTLAPASAELFPPRGASMPLDPPHARDSDRLAPPTDSQRLSPFAPETPYAASPPPRNVEPDMNPFRLLAGESQSLWRDPQPVARDSSPFAPPPARESAPLDALPVAPPTPLQSRTTAEPLDAGASKPLPKRRFCTNCGTPMPYEANFCPACGTPVHRGEGYY